MNVFQRPRALRFWLIAICIAVAIPTSLTKMSTAYGDSILRTVALSGQLAPGGPSGATFDTSGFVFNFPKLNNANQTSFIAALQIGPGEVTESNNFGIWSEGNGSLALVMQEGSQAPGAPAGAKFRDPFPPVFTDAGQTSFISRLQIGEGGVTDSNDKGFWSQRNGSLDLVVRTGELAPDVPLGAKFDDFGSSSINSANQLAFSAELQTGFGGVTDANNQGAWSEGNGTLELIARKGDQAPNTTAGAVFDSIWIVGISDTGNAAFLAELKEGVGGVTSSNQEGFWAQRNGSLQLIARTGTQAPDTPSGANFRALRLSNLNRAGRIAFSANLQTRAGGVTFDNDQGIWSEGSGTLSLVARRGDQAPGTPVDATFSLIVSFNPEGPRLNDAGQTAFTALLNSGSGGVDSDSNSGIWSEGGGALDLVARKGSQAPGTPVGAVFGSSLLPPSLIPFSALSLNNAGQSAFLGSLKIGVGGVTEDNDQGIWAQNRDGVLQLIVREGDEIDVDDGPGVDLRTIERVFPGSGQGGFNDLGQLAFSAMFIDGTAGTFVSNLVAVPEPNSLILAAAAGLLGASASGYTCVFRKN
ncbi:MAG: hypothetical protein GXP24_14725 [Planctomycetes bacterium]|nr:hypothetical protein [Planctomycetota bacterium]